MNKKQPATERISNETRDAVREALIKHGKVKVIGLGVFEVRHIKARPGRNPKTGEIVTIPAYNKIKFRPTQALKKSV